MYHCQKYNERKFSSRLSILTGLTLSALLFSEAVPVYAADSDFFKDSSLDATIYFWNRDRDRKDIESDKYRTNIRQSTFNAALDYKSGFLEDIFGVELGGYGAWEISNGGAHPNEIGFSNRAHRWEEDWSGDRSGVSFYKALAHLKFDNYWAKIGYIQPSGQTLLAPHWSLLPGTYRGFEVGGVFDFGDNGALSASYLWSDRYKAPWYRKLDDFRQWDTKTHISYLHSVGMKYDFKNNLVLEGAFGQSKKYINQYFAKASYQVPVNGNPLNMSYQFYGAKDQGHTGDHVYDGLAWLQALTFSHNIGPIGLRLEGTIVKAEGKQGYFLQRMTPSYASSNGRLDIWWNSRSDFNANGEKSLFAEITYDLGDINLPGWRVGTSYAYGWNAKPNSLEVDQSKRIKESAWNLDLGYTMQSGVLKGTSLNLHYTDYNNHSNIPSWGGGFGNIFQDEKDIKFFIVMPLSVF